LNAGRGGDPPPLDRYTGCLLGGAAGDALGAPVEFLTLRKIRREFGEGGIRNYVVAYGRRGAITDDTQMTLFTAEGLLRAVVRMRHRGIAHMPSVVRHAYLRWLVTQDPSARRLLPDGADDGWLFALPELHHPRAPGNTCLASLYGEQIGSMDAPLNDSKGCGGVMRAAPAGLLAHGADPFRVGCQIAALTHGHPSGWLAAGYLAGIVRALLDGADLRDAVESPMQRLREFPRHEEVRDAVARAIELADAGEASPETVERLGGGWVAEEALAIAVFCALAARGDFERGVTLAVNHSGDSDSTGAIAGNILGAALGESAIPRRWLDDLELRDEIRQVAADLRTVYEESEAWRTRYPGW